jgi:hypothetical protein
VEFLCEDLPQHGLVLIPPSSGEYDSLLADIERRLDAAQYGGPPIPEKFRPRISEADRPTSAILLNRSPKAIAAMQAVWRFETVTGRSYRHSIGMLFAQSLLVPFGRSEVARRLSVYWDAILPGSKRYLGKSGMVGDNSDVRPPAPDEEWQGGVIGSGGGGGGGTRGHDPVKQTTLVLDGVFFLDGEFVGPDREKLFERTTADAEAHQLAAKIARDGHSKGDTPAQIIADIEKATGPAPDYPRMDLAFRNAGATPEDFRRAALQQVAFQFSMHRKLPQFTSAMSTDEQTVDMIMQWSETAVPHFRKA